MSDELRESGNADETLSAYELMEADGITIAALLCSAEGHPEWADAGGGLLVCVRCEQEKWADA